MTADAERVETAEEFLDHLRQYASGYVFVHEYAALDVIRARDSAIRAQAIEECIAVAKQHVDALRAEPQGSYGKLPDEMRAEAIEDLIDELATLAQKAGGE